MKNWQKVFISVFSGSYLGGLMALQLGYLWFLGAMAGGVIGYAVRLLCGDPEKVINATQEAWRKTIGWKPNKQWWKAEVLATCGCLSVILSVVAGIVIIVAIIPTPDSSIADDFYSLFMSTDAGYTWYFIFTMSIILGMTIANIHPACHLKVEPSLVEKIIANEQKRKLAWRLILFRNPLAMLLRGVFYTVLGLVILAKKTIMAAPWLPYVLFIIIPCLIWNSIKAIGRFVKYFFILIHTDELTLCAVDAAIGASLVYFWFASSPLTGAVTGGLFGILNYEVISKRLLKIPVKS